MARPGGTSRAAPGSRKPRCMSITSRAVRPGSRRWQLSIRCWRAFRLSSGGSIRASNRFAGSIQPTEADSIHPEAGSPRSASLARLLGKRNPERADRREQEEGNRINQRAGDGLQWAPDIKPVYQGEQAPECRHSPVEPAAVLVMTDEPEGEQANQDKERGIFLNDVYGLQIVMGFL